MKVLNLQCAHQHDFEGWFGSEDDFQSQLARGFAEEALRGGLDAVRTGAEVRDVEVALEDVALREAALEAEGIADLADLARGAVSAGGIEILGGTRLVDEDVLDVLHREGRRALLDGSRLRVACDGAQDAAQIDAVVVEKARVLDGEDGLPHQGRHAGQRDLDPVLVVDRGEDGSVGGEDEGALRQRRRAQCVGKVLEAAHGIAGDDRRTPEEGHRHQPYEEPGDQSGDQQADQAPEDPEESGAESGRLQHAHQTIRVSGRVPLSRHRAIALS